MKLALILCVGDQQQTTVDSIVMKQVKLLNGNRALADADSYVMVAIYADNLLFVYNLG